MPDKNSKTKIYKAPIMMNEKFEIEGFFSFILNTGHVVVIFEEGPRMISFADKISHQLMPQNKKLGFIDIEAGSFQEVIKSLFEMDSSLMGQASIIDEHDSLYQQIFSQI